MEAMRQCAGVMKAGSTLLVSSALVEAADWLGPLAVGARCWWTCTAWPGGSGDPGTCSLSCMLELWLYMRRQNIIFSSFINILKIMIIALH